jgi:hypothetical protein
MRTHHLLTQGKRYILKPLLNKIDGRGFAGAKKKDVGSFRPTPSGAGLSKRRITPLKFKL